MTCRKVSPVRSSPSPTDRWSCGARRVKMPAPSRPSSRSTRVSYPASSPAALSPRGMWIARVPISSCNCSDLSTEGEDARAFAAFIEKYKGVLSRLQSRGVITAGYVDRPGANLVVQLLELASMSDQQLQDRQAIRTHHPFRGLNDVLLFGGEE